MFENVLVGVDGSASGRDAIALAAALMGAGGSLTLAHTYDGIARASHVLAPATIDGDRARACELLESQRLLAGVEAEIVAVDAVTVGEGLHREAEREGADLLVLGTCHRGAVGRAVLGDHTRAALNGASCAVAVAPAGFARHPGTFAAVGVGYDGSPESERALATARELAAGLGAYVQALRVVTIPYDEYAAVALTAGEPFAALVEHAERELTGIEGVDTRVAYGLPGEELAAFSGEVDMLVVGSRGYGPARRLVLGSTSSYLQRHARGPLLVLPRGIGEARKESVVVDGATVSA
jgi:nucleotide-binding universal stress UspA family protein